VPNSRRRIYSCESSWPRTSERQVKPRSADDATRITLVALARFVARRRLLTIVTPDTLIRWHREGFRLFWLWKSRAPGRPRFPADLQLLIATMALANRTWGEERLPLSSSSSRFDFRREPSERTNPQIRRPPTECRGGRVALFLPFGLRRNSGSVSSPSPFSGQNSLEDDRVAEDAPVTTPEGHIIWVPYWFRRCVRRCRVPPKER
jgi:hypothetical protein